MTTTVLASNAKECLRKSIRALRERLLVDLDDAARGEYQLDVSADKARLPAARRIRRARLEAWLVEQRDPRERAFAGAVKEAAQTLVNRLVMLRVLEHHGLSSPPVVTGGFRSSGYATEFLPYAGPLAADDDKGYGRLLGVVFTSSRSSSPASTATEVRGMRRAWLKARQSGLALARDRGA